MRKIMMLLSTLALISMLLVACAGEATETSAPATDFPTLEEPTVGATEEPVGTATGAATEEGTPVGGIPVTGEEDPSRLSNQLDYNVWNQNGEQIGEVNDMIVDLDNTRISYVIVGTGGFLEIGERDILVPWNSLTLQTEGGDMTGGEQFAFILQADQQLFENALDFDVSTGLPEMGQPAGDWDADLRNYWEGGVVPAGTPATGELGTPATGTGTDTGTGTPDAGTGTTATQGAVGTADANATAQHGTGETVTGELQGVVLASELLGSTVTVGAGGEVMPGTDMNTPDATNGNTNGAVGTGTPDATNSNGNANTNDAQGTPAAGTDTTGLQGDVTTGTIDDVLVDVNTGDILYIVLNATFPDGDRWIPVPLSQFQWDANNASFVLDTDQAMLNEAPFFPEGQYPSTLEDGWDADYSIYWQ